MSSDLSGLMVREKYLQMDALHFVEWNMSNKRGSGLLDPSDVG